MTKRNSQARLSMASDHQGYAKIRVHSLLESELKDIRKSLVRLEEELDAVVDISEGRSPDSRAA